MNNKIQQIERLSESQNELGFTLTEMLALSRAVCEQISNEQQRLLKFVLSDDHLLTKSIAKEIKLLENIADKLNNLI